MTDVDTKGCVRKCCACFSLQGLAPAIVAAQDPQHRDMLLHMLRPLPVLEAEHKWQMWTCRNWDSESQLCMVYEDRPQMCRDYPSPESPCGWEGCTYGS